MGRKLLVCLLVMLPVLAMAQRVQTIKGRVVDKESKMPLMGVAVVVANVQPVRGAATDIDGYYKIDSVEVGKHTLTTSYLGYGGYTATDIIVTSAREVVLNIELEETAIKMAEVEIKTKREHINDMAIVSTRTFDVQETERYAGSRADPARMASNFAGVQGGNDSRNDIVVRGNSPQGVLWRMEGVDIPNPNHFSVPGTTGGPVSMLNSKTLANSDFFMGAFPAEYGNAVAGVFDLKLRNGNNSRYEFTGQLGFLGTELTAEGPISKKKGSSFLVAYRYSTLQLFSGMNIKIGTSSVPRYQDATFKLNFPTKKGNFSVWGIGGLSSIDLLVSTLKEPSQELYGEQDRDQYFTANMGVVGFTRSTTINNTTFMQISMTAGLSDIYAHHEKVFRDYATFRLDSMKNILGYDFTTVSQTLHWFINKKISARHTLKYGLLSNYYFLNLVDSSRQYPTTRQDWQHRSDFMGSTSLLQAYMQYKFKPSDRLTLNGGLHGQYLTHNSTWAIEPRAGLKWLISDKDVLTAGYGLHSQVQQLYQYFAHLPQSPAWVMHNYNIGFTRSHHMVVGYERPLSNVMRLRAESYYQYLFNVPVETRAGSSYSALNQGSSFARDYPGQLKNTGTGYNYGVELTLEKRMAHGYYFMITGSAFDSKAMGNDKVYRNTDFNTRYAVNLLGGYEHKLGRYGTLIAGGKVTMAGGRRYSLVDTAASNLLGDVVIYDSTRNTQLLPAYFRADLKVGARFNSKSVTHEIGLDLVNILNTKNVLTLTYSPDLASQGLDPYYKQYQLGFLPIFYYRIDFGTGKKK